MDEPTNALDPLATHRIEGQVRELKGPFSVLIATQSMQQAARISDRTAFLLVGKLIEYGDTARIFTSPKEGRTSIT